jgi:hypothetical protein
MQETYLRLRDGENLKRNRVFTVVEEKNIRLVP